MAFLLSNDDGAHAQGLAQLAKSLTEAGYLHHVIAPDRDRSGVSNSLTLDRPLHPLYLDNGFIAINGTPTDCVHLGLNALYRGEDYQIDRVIAGINSGANLGDDVIYSGTVAAAMEGRFLDRAPIAISLVGKTHFTTAAKVIVNLLPQIEAIQFPKRTIININVPDVPYEQLCGFEITRLGHRARSDNPVLTTNPRGRECYWISAAGEGADAGEGTDFHAIAQGKVSITPIQADMTYGNALEYFSKISSI